jgi:N-acetyl-D-muramate 6-phosphate phosphatase
MIKSIQSVLFDLDGTLVDTAPDLTHVLNQMRHMRHLTDLPLTAIRSRVSLGSKALLNLAFNIDEQHADYPLLLEQFFNLYQNHLCDSTQLFPDIENVLSYLDHQAIPWGIVTNKPSVLTLDLLRALKLIHRPACIICGDTLTKHKPDPDQILHACQLLKCPPQQTLYVGDAAIDVTASKAAGSFSLVALYGYIGQEENPYAWQADGYVSSPQEIIPWLTKCLAC